MPKYKFKFSSDEARRLVTHKSVLEFLELLSKKKEKKSRTFKAVAHDGHADVYVNAKDKIVIKYGGIYYWDKRSLPKRAIPTAYLHDKTFQRAMPKYCGRVTQYGIRIQPLADVSVSVANAAHEYFQRKFDFKYSIVGGDCHEGNVGKYKNKYVVIDW